MASDAAAEWQAGLQAELRFYKVTGVSLRSHIGFIASQHMTTIVGHIIQAASYSSRKQLLSILIQTATMQHEDLHSVEVIDIFPPLAYGVEGSLAANMSSLLTWIVTRPAVSFGRSDLSPSRPVLWVC